MATYTRHEAAHAFEKELRARCIRYGLYSFEIDDNSLMDCCKVTLSKNSKKKEYIVRLNHIKTDHDIAVKLNTIFDDFFRADTTYWVGLPKIDEVIFNGPATIVKWADGTKTVVKCCEDDEFDAEKGLAMAISKKALGDLKEVKKLAKKYNEEIGIVQKIISELDASLERARRNLFGRAKMGVWEGDI